MLCAILCIFYHLLVCLLVVSCVQFVCVDLLNTYFIFFR